MSTVFSRLLLSLSCLGLLTAEMRGDEWPQWRGPQRDGVWRETGLIDRFPAEQVEVAWRKPIGPGYSGPTVADGRVYVSDRLRRPNQIERVHCFDAKTGDSIWVLQYPCDYTISYEAGPRASISIDGKRAFSLGAMGHLYCLDAISGDVIWNRDLDAEFKISSSRRMPIWGIAASPLVYKDLVIVHIGAEENASIVAFDKQSGAEQWRALSDRAQYSAPILIEQAGKPVLVCWTGDSVAGLNPGTGKVYWRHSFVPSRMPIGIASPLVHENRLFVTSFYDGALMLKLRQDNPAVDVLWRRKGPDEKNTDALHSIISTPLFTGSHVYGVDSYGELRCLDAGNGDRLWQDQTATPRARWSTIHFVENRGKVWMLNERGELIISELSPQGFHEISRAKLIKPTLNQLNRRDGVCWAHPAFAYKHVFARNDEELICASLEAD